jgi:hypothetical protein
MVIQVKHKTKNASEKKDPSLGRLSFFIMFPAIFREFLFGINEKFRKFANILLQ